MITYDVYLASSSVYGAVKINNKDVITDRDRSVYTNNRYIYLNESSINDLGDDVGTGYSGNNIVAFSYVAGKAAPLPNPSGAAPGSFAATGINNGRTIVGFLANGEHSFSYDGNSYTLFDAPNASATYAMGISNNGDIVGYYVDALGRKTGFLDRNGTFTKLRDPGADFTVAVAVNVAGEIIGYAGSAGGGVHGFIEHGGVFENLPSFVYPAIPGSPTGINSLDSTQPTGLNDAGEMISSSPYQDFIIEPHGVQPAQSLVYKPFGIISYDDAGNLVAYAQVSALGGGKLYNFTAGSILQGKPYTSFTNLINANGALQQQTLLNAAGEPLKQTDYNGDGSVYLSSTVSKNADGTFDYHGSTGSYFANLPFASLDRIESTTGALLSETQNNADGTLYQQIGVSTDATTGDYTYHFAGGSFFADKAFDAYDNLATYNNVLLQQEIVNNDGSHSFTVPGSGLIVTAAHNDSIAVTGGNDKVFFSAPGFGADTLQGFQASDKIVFDQSVFTDYTAIAQHVSGTGSAVLTDASHDTLTLAGIVPSQVTSTMFAFV